MWVFRSGDFPTVNTLRWSSFLSLLRVCATFRILFPFFLLHISFLFSFFSHTVIYVLLRSTNCREETRRHINFLIFSHHVSPTHRKRSTDAQGRLIFECFARHHIPRDATSNTPRIQKIQSTSEISQNFTSIFSLTFSHHHCPSTGRLENEIFPVTWDLKEWKIVHKSE